ncbi:hypothetical protein E1B28_005527 [Marasmius oreades]|uniref:DUF6699 domain-containing protein n=1 Tax=Marasmius oreades TaxID=181124 RepID=A0A9P7S3N0_9AGAR|nr:uncharacterized protein E1B28_005527 [Marasmius oreades]KAG7094707.1 hypothetical protein E1B28_005527 [Marasmius oreades]
MFTAFSQPLLTAHVLPAFGILSTPPTCIHNSPFWNHFPQFTPQRYHSFPYLHPTLASLYHPLPHRFDHGQAIVPSFQPNQGPQIQPLPVFIPPCHFQLSPPHTWYGPLPSWPSPPRRSPTEPVATVPWQSVALPPPTHLQITPVLNLNESAPYSPHLIWDVTRDPRNCILLARSPSSPLDWTAPAFNVAVTELILCFRSGWMRNKPIIVRNVPSASASALSVGFILDTIYHHLRNPLSDMDVRYLTGQPEDPDAMGMLVASRRWRESSRRDANSESEGFLFVDALGPNIYFQGLWVVGTNGRGSYTVEICTLPRIS